MLLGEFVEKDGKLYFVRADTIQAGLDKIKFHSDTKSTGFSLSYLFSAALGCGIIGLILLIVVVFPMALFVLLGSVVLTKFIQDALK